MTKEQQAIDTFLRSVDECRGVEFGAERSFFNERGKLIAVVNPFGATGLTS